MVDKVSVIVTCYNHEQYIEQCLMSIFEQTYQEIELLVINDGSTDDSDTIIKQTLKQSPFTVAEYIKQENMGICVTRNRGLEWINGNFVLFVDSDNYLDINYIEELLNTAHTEHADIIYADLFNPETQETFVKAKKFDLMSFLEENYIDNCSLIRVNKIEDARYDLNLNRKKLVDYEFLLGLVLNNDAKPTRNKKTKLNYRVLENSISRTAKHSSEKFYYEVYLYILEKYVDTKKSEVMEAIKWNIYRLEDRLDDLINHLGDVTVYVQSLEEDVIAWDQKIHLLENEIKELKELTAKLSNVKNQIFEEKETLGKYVEELRRDNELLRNSTSYRLGNFIVKPINYSVRIIKNPKLVRVALGRIKRFTLRKIAKIPTPRKLILTQKRKANRSVNNYIDPKRLLIYVIYESQDHLQKYKLLFLEALAKLSEEVLIVINGELPEDDLSQLNKYGQVLTRENSGYDTAAFKFGISNLGKDKIRAFDELLLVNDTNIGPIYDLKKSFDKMAEKRLDFWGISYGEEQPDQTRHNKYGFIPVHLQTYFLAIEKSMLLTDEFYDYWENLGDTNSRTKAIGKHETVFTKHFEDLGFKHGALAENNQDSAMYIHPLKMLEEGVPIIKYTALSNYDSEQFVWQDLVRESEVPELMNYLETESEYPVEIVKEIITDIRTRKVQKHVLIIDGVDNIIPQLTKYRVENKVEQLVSQGFKVVKVSLPEFRMSDIRDAFAIIIYRSGYTDQLGRLCTIAKKYNKPVLYDIDDLVIDTKYTDQLSYTKSISSQEKANYDAGVNGYKKMLLHCDGAITTTKKLKEELMNYQSLVLLNRNLASKELVSISKHYIKDYSKNNEEVRIGYFSGSITHNENFELIKPAIIKLLKKYANVKLHLVGHLDIPKDIAVFDKQIVTHDFVDWRELPQLLSQIDINLAPLVNSIFNQAKSEIKWLEAALIKIPTVASNLGAFAEMIQDDQTGVLVADDEWYEKLDSLIQSSAKRQTIGENAYQFVLGNCITTNKKDDLVEYLYENENN